MKRILQKMGIVLSALLLAIPLFLFAACGDVPEEPATELIMIIEPRLEYEEGEKFDTSGMQVNAFLEDGTTKENVKCTIEPQRALTISDNFVAVRYGGQQITLKITVNKKGNRAEYSVENTPTLENSPLTGKTYFFLGSSVTFGSASKEESMADFIAKRNNCTSIKEAVSGTTLANLNNRSYVSRFDSYLQKADRATTVDAFICQLSTNDTRNADKFGTVTANDVKDKTAFDNTTTFGAIENIIALAKETWNCPVVFYTNSYYKNDNYATMVAGLKQIQTKWGITLIDLYSDTAFNNITSEQRTLYMHNDIHPTRAGYRDWWVPKFEETLKSL